MSTIKANKIENLSSSDGGISIDGSGMVTFPGNEGVKFPKGTTAERPSSADDGSIRLNTTTGKLEVFTSTLTTWIDINASGLAQVDWLVVAGGGSGGGYSTGYFPGSDGSNSVFATNTAIGGGGGGVSYGSTTGRDGGSGGGGNASGSGGSGTSGQGHDGGDSTTSTYFPGGGGGAGAAGADGVSGTPAGAGGIGKESSITGVDVYYAGGGGGGTTSAGVFGAGGNGGGGAGGGNTAGTDGTVNTGGGGGGGAYGAGAGAGGYLEGTAFTPVLGTAYTVTVGAGGAAVYSSYAPYRSGAGGSGVVIFSYPTQMTAAYSSGVTKTTTTVGSNTVDKITATSSTSETVTWST